MVQEAEEASDEDEDEAEPPISFPKSMGDSRSVGRDCRQLLTTLPKAMLRWSETLSPLGSPQAWKPRCFEWGGFYSTRDPTFLKSVGSTLVQCVDHQYLFVVELFRFLSLGLELSGDLPPWSVFALTTLAGLSGM